MTGRVRRFLLSAACCAAVLPTGGCAIGNWLAAMTLPPPKDPALFEIPEGKTVLVLPDDPFSRVAYEPFRQDLATEINRLLVENEVTKAAIPFQDLADLEVRTNNLDGLSSGEIRRKLGADIVIYVPITQWALKDDPASTIWHGRTNMLVRVIDVDEGLLWPRDRRDGWPIEPVEIPTGETSAGYATTMSRKLALAAAKRVAEMFYDHKISNTLVKRPQ